MVLKENGGQASALNAGIEHCEGDVVMFLDADDVLRPEAAARVAAAFAADETVAKVQFRMDVIDADGRPTGAIKPARTCRCPAATCARAELAFPFDITWMATSANAFRIEALRRIFPIPERDYPVSGADWYLVHLTALLGTVVSLEEVSASYRVHGRNNYEPQAAELSLDHVRKAIDLRRTPPRRRCSAWRRARRSPPGPHPLPRGPGEPLVSLRLEPRAASRSPPTASAACCSTRSRAARRRSNVSAAMKAMFVAWFAAMAIAPRRLARRLAVVFLFPERRASFNGVLRRLHRDRQRRCDRVGLR